MKYSSHIPAGRFIFLSFISFGWFPVVLMYRQWKFIQAQNNKAITPWFRAWFSIFFIPSLGKNINKLMKKKKIKYETSPWQTWAIYTVLMFIPFLQIIKGVALLDFNDCIKEIEEKKYKIPRKTYPLWHEIGIALLFVAAYLLLVFITS